LPTVHAAAVQHVGHAPWRTVLDLRSESVLSAFSCQPWRRVDCADDFEPQRSPPKYRMRGLSAGNDSDIADGFRAQTSALVRTWCGVGASSRSRTHIGKFGWCDNGAVRANCDLRARCLQRGSRISTPREIGQCAITL